MRTMQCSLAAVLWLVAQLCLTLYNPTDCTPPGFSVHGDPPGKNTGVNSHALLQGIFPIQGLNPCLLHLPALAEGLFITEPPGNPDGDHNGC